MAYRSVLRIQLPVTMQPRAKHPLQRIPTWVALSIGIIVGLFVSKMFTGVSPPRVLRPVHSFPVPTPTTILYSVVRVHPRGAGEHVKSSRSSAPTIILPPSLVIVPRCSSDSQPPPALHAEHYYMGRLSRGCRALPNHIRDRMRWNSPCCQASKILASTSTTFIFIAPVMTRCTY